MPVNHAALLLLLLYASYRVRLAVALCCACCLLASS
jgi:hypothetical protein